MYDRLHEKRQPRMAGVLSAEEKPYEEIASSSIPNSAMISLAAPGEKNAPDRQGKTSSSTQAQLLESRAGTERKLSAEMREKMESRFGRSMAGLTILESPEVREAGARAYAKGNVIRFAPGQFDQQSEGGQEMIAHEIAHVVQQSQGRVRADRPDSPLASDHALESQADASYEAGLSHVSSLAPLNAPAFESAPAQMWPWSKKKRDSSARRQLTPQQQMEQQVARQAQQVVQSRRAAPAAPQQHRVDTGNFRFDKMAYLFDSELRNFKGLLDAYNTGGATPEQEIALMNAAAQYIDKHSTGKKAKHQGRTAMMEDVLYQLTMKGGTKEKADANIARLHESAAPLGQAELSDQQLEGLRKQGKTQAEIDDEQNKIRANWEGYRTKGQEILSKFPELYNSEGSYSKSMQMIAADVMSRQGRTMAYRPGEKSSAGEEYTPDEQGGENKGYYVNGRIIGSENDAIGTNLHEFTHVAAGEAYDNSPMYLNYEAKSDPNKVNKEIRRRMKRLNKIEELSKNPEHNGLELGDAATMKSLPSFISGRRDYAGGANRYFLSKTEAQYIGPQLSKLRDKEGDSERIKARKAADRQKITDFRDQIIRRFDDGRVEEQVDGKTAENDRGRRFNADAMVEYEPVINQMLVQFEHAGGDRNSQYYRNLKAEALNNHVRRRTAALHQQMRGRR